MVPFPSPRSYNRVFFHPERHGFQPSRATLSDRRLHAMLVQPAVGGYTSGADWGIVVPPINGEIKVPTQVEGLLDGCDGFPTEAAADGRGHWC